MTYGIICEYNPMHRGHEYMIKKLRDGGETTVVCLMSGNFVQRGDCAVCDKYDRAEAAVRSGADLVLELPFPWSCASAGYFAAAGVHILTALGIKNIAFGSESASLDMLVAAADASEAAMVAATADEGYAAAYYSAINRALGKSGETRLPPNDILGVEYIRAARRLGRGVEFTVVRREGAGYHDTEADAEFPSATALRAAILDGNFPRGMTEASAELVRKAISEGRAPARIEGVGAAAVWRFRSGGAELAAFAECGGGVSGRLANAARDSGTLRAMLGAAATKKYTDARLRRAVIFALTGTYRQDLDRLPAYTTVLAAGARGRAFLASVRRSAAVAVATRPSDALDMDGEAARRQTALLLSAESLYSLMLPAPSPAGGFLRRSPRFFD